MVPPTLPARLVAAGRIALGGAFTLLPRTMAGAWVGPTGRRAEVVPLTRALGVRDLLIGVGAWRAAARPGGGARPWLAMGAAADATDVVASLAAWRHLPARRRVALVVLASTATATQVVLARLDQ